MVWGWGVSDVADVALVTGSEGIKMKDSSAPLCVILRAPGWLEWWNDQCGAQGPWARHLSLTSWCRAESGSQSTLDVGRRVLSLVKWTSEATLSCPSSQGSQAVGGSRGVGARWGRRRAQVEVGALGGRGRGAALFSRKILGSGSRGWRVGVRVWVKVHVVLVVFAMAAVACSLPAACWWCQPSRQVVGGVVAVTDVRTAGRSRWSCTTNWVVGSDGQEAQT